MNAPSSPNPHAVRRRGVKERLDRKLFDTLYARSLVANASWEDPAVDREALGLGPADHVLAIAGSGCNVLDYALQGPARIDAVDANPRQTALLELKLAAIRRLEFDDFFEIFGKGFHAGFRNIYRQRLRGELSDFARAYWDRRYPWFISRHGSFYLHGLAGFIARSFHAYFRLYPGLDASLEALFAAGSVDEQRRIYDERLAGGLWTPFLGRLFARQLSASLLGVPGSQRHLLPGHHPDGVAGFVRSAVERALCRLPAGDNYFWRLCLTGRYRRDCAPAYLHEAGFRALQGGLVERIRPHGGDLADFLLAGERPISRFVLADHLDRLAEHRPPRLAATWRAIVRRAAPDARLLLRSAQPRPSFVDCLAVAPAARRLADLLTCDPALGERLRMADRAQAHGAVVVARLAGRA